MQVRTNALFAALSVFALIALAGCNQEGTANAGDTDTEAPVAADTGGGATEVPLKQIVKDKRQEAMKAGKYNCCLKHPCSECLIAMGGCPCRENAEAGNPVCSECKGGWMAGDGAIPDLDAADITAMPRGGMDESGDMDEEEDSSDL